MRCLGRLITLVVLLVLAAGAWFFRDDIRRRYDREFHPGVAIRRVGYPSQAALARARHALDSLQTFRRDSVILSADEMTSLLATGSEYLPGATFDSISMELGDRTVRVRTLVDSARISPRLRAFIPGARSHYEEVVVAGTLNPVRAGLAEFDVDHVSLHGIPLPVDVVARIAQAATGKTTGSRLDVVLPQMIGGFRVRPEGVTIYRQGARP
jgi:hypothetical protein